MSVWQGVIKQYQEFIDLDTHIEPVTLLEGNTPLIFAPELSKLKEAKVYLKLEGMNPTGSFKDRGMTVAITRALSLNAKAVVCASTGNTSASAAAYAARAGIKCAVVIPDGYIALGKLAQALIHGALIIQLKGNFDEALKLVRLLPEKAPVEIVNSINPFRIEGQKTAAFEICDALGEAPDYQFIPVGNAGNITAYWKGYLAYKEIGRTTKLPKLMGFQAKGAAPIVEGHPVENPETVATAIRIGNPASWYSALSAANESKGKILAVSDEQILDAYKFLASKEAIFCEPASAASVAGLISSPVEKGSVVVCILTGHGLKDPDIAISQVEVPKRAEADLSQILEILDLS